jgi:hypothetical protein
MQNQLSALKKAFFDTYWMAERYAQDAADVALWSELERLDRAAIGSPEQRLKCFEPVLKYAARYAHGRHTYAPHAVRRVVRIVQKAFPQWKPQHDDEIKAPENVVFSGAVLEGDYLHDIFCQP